MPVVVAVRMSLNFPLLLSAVPLHAIDFSRVKEEDRRLERCWFSDGGISSNFPVQRRRNTGQIISVAQANAASMPAQDVSRFGGRGLSATGPVAACTVRFGSGWARGSARRSMIPQKGFLLRNVWAR